MRKFSVTTIVLALCLYSGPTALSALSRPPVAEKPAHREVPVSIWSDLWRTIQKFAGLLKNGSGIDPFGHPTGSVSSAPTPAGDNGSGIDPFGGS
jgi:hypothetical protein